MRHRPPSLFFRMTTAPLLLVFLASGAYGATGTGVKGQVLIQSEPAVGAVVTLGRTGTNQTAETSNEEIAIQQENLQFKPDFLVVPAGTTIRFENRDDEIHNIRSNAPANRFDTGAHMPGGIKKVTLKNPGGVPLRCRTHEKMRGFVYVTPTPFFAVTNERGEFEIKDAPPGDYRITAWHPRLTPEEQAQGAQELTVGRGPRTVSLRMQAKAPTGANLAEVSTQDWSPIVDQIEVELSKAISLWKDGKSTPATSKVMRTQSRLYGESGLREAIDQRLGKASAAVHEHRIDSFRKHIQGIGGDATETALQSNLREIVNALQQDAERLQTGPPAH